jgi:hypothetical protein
MKKLLMLIILLLPMWAMAQTDSLANKAEEQYCMVTEVPKSFSTAVNISVDFGQRGKMFGVQRLKDEEGKVKAFNSIVDALNYMASMGWELVSTSFTVSSPDSYTTRYIMKKKVE